MTSLLGRTAIVTGASQGLGEAVARRFIASGANVALTARTSSTLLETRENLQKLCGPDQRVIAIACDVGNRSAVDELMRRTLEAFSSLDIVVNNASVFGPMGRLEDVDLDDWISTMTTNLIGTVNVCKAAIPHLKRSLRGKILNIAGGGAVRPLPALSAYAASKAAVVRFSETLAQELAPYGIDVNSVAPGPLNTRFIDEVISAGPGKIGAELYDEILLIRRNGGTPFEVGAGLCAYLSSRTSDGVTGKLISARFDNWRDFHHRIDELRKSDLYTLRRIDS